jgi:hypothetical protein
VYIAFASDSEERVPGLGAIVAKALSARGADVSIILFPVDESQQVLGVGRFLAGGGTQKDLLELAAILKPLLSPVLSGPYTLTTEGTYWNKITKDGVVPTLIANFTARITRDTILDDGAETTRTFTIEARFGIRGITVEIPAARFGTMTWPLELLGAQAIVSPTMTALQHLRAAIQFASENVPTLHVYRHTGWISTEAYGPLFLHSNGALGANGSVSNIEVRLDQSLSGYCLPEPPTMEILRERVRASLEICNVIADRVILPILAAVYRAPVGDIDMSVFMSGRTGVGKSEIAALAQQHYGAALDARHLPASWSSTENALEELAFMAKDAVLVVDDFVLTDPTQAQRLHLTAERLLRAQGNRSARQRMRSDTTLRPPRPPRGLILSTGEDVPRGQSLNARFLHVPVAEQDVFIPDLTDAQARAARGEYAEAFSGYIVWLAQRRNSPDVRERARKLRVEVNASHRRTADGAANIAVGLQLWLEYATDIGALSSEEANQWWTRGWTAIQESAHAQGATQNNQEPTYRFLELLRSAIASGHANVTSLGGKAPVDAEAWGWHPMYDHSVVSAPLKSMGERIGWTDGQALYLEPTTAYAVAHARAAASGDPFTTSLHTLKRRLFEQHLLIEREEDRDVFTVRRTLSGVRREVLYLSVSQLRGTSDHSLLPPHNEIPTKPTPSTLVGSVGDSEGGESPKPQNDVAPYNTPDSVVKDDTDHTDASAEETENDTR